MYKAYTIDIHINYMERSFQYLEDGYLSLSGWTETQLKNLKAQFTTANGQLLDDYSKTHQVVQAHERVIEHISHLMCIQHMETLEDEFEALVTRSFITQFTEIGAQLDKLESGLVPSALNQTYLLSLCDRFLRPYPDSSFCQEVTLRDLFHTKMRTAYLDKQIGAIVLYFTMNFSETPSVSHKIYKIHILPVFPGHFLTHKSLLEHARNFNITRKDATSYILKFHGQYFAEKINGRGKNSDAVVYEDCLTENGITTCSTMSPYDDKICILAIIDNHENDMRRFCKFEKIHSFSSCFSQPVASGIIISSLEDLTVHKTRINNHTPEIFRKSRKIRKGLFIGPNNDEVS